MAREEDIIDVEIQTIDALLIGGRWYVVRHIEGATAVIITHGVRFVTLAEDEDGVNSVDDVLETFLNFDGSDEDGGSAREMTVPFRSVQAIRHRLLRGM